MSSGSLQEASSLQTLSLISLQTKKKKMSKPWGGGIGAWALEAEREEAEEKEQQLAAQAQAQSSFPSLKEAAQAKPKKKKPVPIPLAQFVAEPLTHDELLRLPTAPRERAPEELEFAGRRGFSSYGGGPGPRRGGYDEPRRGPPPPRASDMDLPSRADEVDNWAASKKQFAAAPMDRARGQDRYPPVGGSSRADEVDNWAAGKKPMQQSFGSGYNRSSLGGGGSDSDRWARGGGGGGMGLNSINGERRRLVLVPPKKEAGGAGAGNEAARSQSRPSPFGAARPREEVLTEKGLDWRKIDLEIEAKKTGSRPTSSHSSRPSSAQSSRPGSSGSQMGAEGEARPRRRVNPFGEAKPREIVLQAQGKDWKKIDVELEHRRVDRPETDEEKVLKEEIIRLQSQEENLKSNMVHVSAEGLSCLHKQILEKERELELLTRQLDDMVRFGQRERTRPISGVARSSGKPLDARPNSQSGAPEELRNSEVMERPRSRGGMADAWARPVDGRRGFQSGFFGNRDLDRPRSRERW